MLNITTITRKSIGGVVSYYADGADDYYAKDGQSMQWEGEGAKALGLDGEVDQNRFRELLNGKLSDTERLHRPVKEGAKERLGYDLTFSAPKGVSLQALVHGDHKIVQAHDRAVKAAIHEAERLAMARSTTQGKTQIEHTNNLAVATFRHETSRAKDPDLHTHAFVLNATQRADGQWRSLTNDGIVNSLKHLGNVYKAELAKELQKEGFDLRFDRNGTFDLAHFSEEQIKAFSARSTQIEAALAEQGLDRDSATQAQKNVASLSTRDRKEAGIDREQLRQEWQKRANELGIDFDSREWAGAGGRNVVERNSAPTIDTSMTVAQNADRCVEFAIRSTTERQAIVKERELLETATKHGYGVLSVGDVRAAMARKLEGGHLIRETPVYHSANADHHGKGGRKGKAEEGPARHKWTTWIGGAAMIPALYALYQTWSFNQMVQNGTLRIPVELETWHFGWPLLAASGIGIVMSWFHQRDRARFSVPDLVLIVCSVAVAAYLLVVFNTSMRMTTGTAFAPVGISFAAVAGSALIMELTRRVAGLALVVIGLVFLVYVFAGPYLPGFLGYPGLSVQRFFSQVYTDAGILGPTTAVSSTYIILFIIFAAFLQASKVGDYFVNFAFAAAGRSRGGPAKVAIFASGLMGMINGTSAGNVVSTGSLTIPLMKRVGYSKESAGAVEAAASTGGQIMPPIMGAGAFIMAEITGIPYTEIAIAAIIPAILYFASVFFMVDFEAKKLGMRGMRADELPNLRRLARQVYLFAPIIILIVALFQGYSVIRAGTLATVSAAVVSWISPNKMGVREILRAFEIAAYMSIQIIVVCAAAGIIVGVISLTGVGARFSVLLLDVAAHSHLLALVFAMFISILLGMGMPTTAAYAVAASVVAPGLVQLGIEPLTAHFFVFYFAVVSAITPPVALASYAAAGISGANAMATSVASFRIGIAAFIVPFMFFYS